MTQAQKLQALAEEAMSKGYYDASYMNAEGDELYSMAFNDLYGDRPLKLLFNKDFARALFQGNDWQGAGWPFDDLMLTDSQYHLMRAVISDNPIDYYYNEVFTTVS